MALIGFSVGFIGFLMHQFIDLISDTKWENATKFLEVKFGPHMYTLHFSTIN